MISIYIGKQALESTYGAAASLAVLLVWIYYSSQIVLLGAEFTHVYTKRRRSAKQRPHSVQPWLQQQTPRLSAAFGRKLRPNSSTRS